MYFKKLHFFTKFNYIYLYVHLDYNEDRFIMESVSEWEDLNFVNSASGSSTTILSSEEEPQTEHHSELDEWTEIDASTDNPQTI